MGMSQLSFLAIDFETANPDQASVCQVGVAKVVDGAIVESTSWLVKPPTGVNSFEPRFIRIHGITPKHVRRAGISWRESLDRIHHLAEDLPLVAHNVSFDRTVYRRASERVGIAVPSTTWFDTLVIARRFITAPNHRLPTVATALELPDFRHHEAEADAITCARIAIELSQKHQLHSVTQLWDRPTRRRSYFPARRFTRVGDLPDPNPLADPNHPLHGQHVVITGDLNGFSRDDFIAKVAELGARPQLNVTKKTTVLVVADHQVFPANYDPASGTGKEKKAHEYRLAGQRIELVAGRAALEMLTWQVEEPSEPVPEPLDEPVELPVEPPPRVEIPELPRETPVNVQPVPVVLDKPVDLPVVDSQPQQLPQLPQQARPVADQQDKSKPRITNPARIIRPVSWCLVGVSAVLVFLWLVGVIGAALTDPDFTVASWILAASLITPILAAPGFLGWYLLRRYPAAT